MSHIARNLVSELRIFESGRTLFDKDDQYEIPLYQRAYAWGENEIAQLIDDINDVDDSVEHYCLGSLIVSWREKDGKYEVVDGQQRLTTLFLLLYYLKTSQDFDKSAYSLSFECRDKSNYTLNHISDLVEEIKTDERKQGILDAERIEHSLQSGIRIIAAKLGKLKAKDAVFFENFCKKLEKVIIYRIEVPEHTDLNHYFEIMNVRGEQLEQHDILKERLMKCLKEKEHEPFALIWGACSDMTGYVQMHRFAPKLREEIFGKEWNRLPSALLDLSKFGLNGDHKPKYIQEIIKPAFSVQDDFGENEKNERIRFESIIDFPYFLLHTLKIFAEIYCEPNSDLIPSLLDDKHLTDIFDKVIDKGVLRGIGTIKDNSEEFSRRFIVTLLRCRYLFDKFIVKREFTNEDKVGTWSLKELKIFGEGMKKKAYYVNTLFGIKEKWKQQKTFETRQEEIHAENLMLQSCLRVSYTSPKIMHWITKLLKWLMQSDCENLSRLNSYGEQIEKIACEAVHSDYLQLSDIEREKLGVNTPHIVFNYLDYLLWHEKKKEFDSFVFEFRNSVEHWYPRNPSEGTFECWEESRTDPEDNVNNFGNLCIISRSVNSKFSNMAPEAKKSTFGKMIKEGSLKLRLMSELTKATEDMSASVVWKKQLYREHGREMLIKLREACRITSSSEDE